MWQNLDQSTKLESMVSTINRHLKSRPAAERRLKAQVQLYFSHILEIYNIVRFKGSFSKEKTTNFSNIVDQMGAVCAILKLNSKEP